MQLHLENIGKLTKADIEIKGITVIAGENDTGKSTVGKVLFSVFDSFYSVEEKIKNTRINMFAHELGIMFTDKYDEWRINSKKIADEMFKNSSKYSDPEQLSKLIDSNAEHFICEDEGLTIVECDDLDVDKIFLYKVKQLYKRYSSIPTEKICENIFNQKIKREFNYQVLNVYAESKTGKISLKIKGKQIDLSIKDNVIELTCLQMSLKTEIIYIDDPFILDNLEYYRLYRRSDFIQVHKKQMIGKLISRKIANDIDEAFRTALVSERLKALTDKINNVCGGELLFDSRNGFVYSSAEDGQNFNIKNISAGLKSFVIIKTLLINGTLKDNGTIILDEPEVHLHPKWQILLAEIIVLLHKEFNMHILLTTHSPYFLEAIEVYSNKYEVNSKCKYYLAENVGRSAEITDVTSDTDKIYQKLARPFQDLENERYGDD